jgi:hypothetical protein
MGKRFAIVIGAAAAGVIALGAQTVMPGRRGICVSAFRAA